MIKELLNFLECESILHEKNHNLTNSTYFKRGGNVNCYICPNNLKDFIKSIIFLKSNDLEYILIGSTSNTIFLNSLNYSIILCTKNVSNIDINDDLIKVETGFILSDFVRIVSIINKSSGYEGLEGIPGTIGAAIYINAGAYGYSISDNLISVDILDENNEVITLNKSQCFFSYRNSIFKNKEWTIISALFKLKKGEMNLISENINKFHIARHSYQDWVYPNLGSLFSTGKSDIYKLILKEKYTFGSILYTIMFFFFKNPIIKFVQRKNPNNIIFNYTVKKFFNSDKTISNKNLNILVNNNESDKVILEHVINLKSCLPDSVRLENQIITSSLSSNSNILELDNLLKKINDIS
jgi:UDP-N-acetylmuramate dehydrogenase